MRDKKDVWNTESNAYDVTGRAPALGPTDRTKAESSLQDWDQAQGESGDSHITPRTYLGSTKKGQGAGSVVALGLYKALGSFHNTTRKTSKQATCQT